MSEIEEEIEELGYQIFAVSPSQPRRVTEIVADRGYRYTLLSDSELRVADAFGLVWRMGDEQVAQYRQYGLDLQAESGHDHQLLPVPAAYLVGSDGIVDFAYVNPDHRTRIPPDLLLAAARIFGEAEAKPETEGANASSAQGDEGEQ